MSFQTGVTNLYNEFVNKGVTPSGQTLAAMKNAVTTLYNKGKSDGVTVHSTTYTMTTAEKTKDLGAAHNYRYINANNVYNAGTTAGKGSHSTTYTMTSSEKTKDLGTSHSYRYINANNVYNAGSNSSHHSTTYTLAASEKTKDLGAAHNYRYINANNVYNNGSSVGYNTATSNRYNNPIIRRINTSSPIIKTDFSWNGSVSVTSGHYYIISASCATGFYFDFHGLTSLTGCTILWRTYMYSDLPNTFFALVKATSGTIALSNKKGTTYLFLYAIDLGTTSISDNDRISNVGYLSAPCFLYSRGTITDAVVNHYYLIAFCGGNGSGGTTMPTSVSGISQVWKASTAGDSWGHEYLMFGKATSKTITPNSSGSYRSTLYIDFGPL